MQWQKGGRGSHWSSHTLRWLTAANTNPKGHAWYPLASASFKNYVLAYSFISIPYVSSLRARTILLFHYIPYTVVKHFCFCLCVRAWTFVCVCQSSQCHSMCVEIRDSLGSSFLYSVMLVLGTELSLPGLAASTFSLWAISLVSVSSTFLFIWIGLTHFNWIKPTPFWEWAVTSDAFEDMKNILIPTQT